MLADPEDISLAKRVKAAKYIAKTDVRLCGHKKTLLLYLFPAAQMRKGKAEAAYRVFLTHDDYITQDLGSKSVHWLTGQLCSIAWSYEDYSNKDWITFADDESVERVAKFYKRFKESDPIEIIRKFQEKILTDRKMVRYKEIIAKINKRMEEVPALPHGWKHWVEESALFESRYIFYEYRNRKTMDGYCTHCHHDVKVEHPHHGKPGVCPRCGSPITFKAIGKSTCVVDQKYVTLVQRAGNGFIFRGFFACKDYRDDYRAAKLDVYETVRAFSDKNFHIKNSDCFSYGMFRPDYHVMRWKDDTQAGVYYDSAVYPKNLKEILSDTKCQYSSIWTLLESNPGKRIDILAFLKGYKPCYEYLIKMGFPRLVMEDFHGGDLSEKAKSIPELFEVPKAWIPELKKMDLSKDELHLFQAAYKVGRTTTAEEVRKIENTIGARREIFSLKVSTTHKILKYFKPMIHKHWNGCDASDSFVTWRDYIGFCKGLKWDLKNEFILFPKDLQKAHDEAMDLLEAKKDEAVDKKIREMYQSHYSRFHWEYKELTMVVPRCAEDIRKEGQDQHNCVATYVERVARKNTVILFLRKKSEPEKSYYTVEYNKGRVIQCRRFANGGMTKEIHAAIQKFERDMAARAEKTKIGVGAA
jgi:DNA-directed RNA polymerase subunit RPC12/RpoP